jgi:hypothetical protein
VRRRAPLAGAARRNPQGRAIHWTSMGENPGSAADPGSQILTAACGRMSSGLVGVAQVRGRAGRAEHRPLGDLRWRGPILRVARERVGAVRGRRAADVHGPVVDV